MTPSSTAQSPRYNSTKSEIIFQALKPDSLSVKEDQKSCELCQEQFNGPEQLVVHLNDRHQDIPDFCGRIACRKKGRWKKRELIRHLKQHSDHQSSATPIFHCRCKATFKRRSKFRDHLKKFTCKGDQLLRCWCGEVTFDCRTGDDMRGFEDHFRSCGLRKKGRPPKDRK